MPNPNVPIAAQRTMIRYRGRISKLEAALRTARAALESAERCLVVYDREGANNAELLVVRDALPEVRGALED